MKSPEVSIIVPCYQQGNYLYETLLSIQNQSFQDWECLVVNDGSTDQTSKIATIFCDLDLRFKYIFQENNGVSSARNLGLKNAQGNFIQFIDCDDLLQSDKIKAQLNFLKQNPQIDIVYGTSRYFFTDNPLDLFPVHYKGFLPAIEMHYSDKNQLATLLKINVSTICATLYRNKVFKKGLKFKPIVFEDFLFHLECSFKGFCFHFERHYNAHCLIRMTDESQMEKHINQNNKTDEFNKELNALIKIYIYSSPFIKTKNEVKQNEKINFLKKIVSNLTPPIFFKIFRLLKF